MEDCRHLLGRLRKCCPAPATPGQFRMLIGQEQHNNTCENYIEEWRHLIIGDGLGTPIFRRGDCGVVIFSAVKLENNCVSSLKSKKLVIEREVETQTELTLGVMRETN